MRSSLFDLVGAGLRHDFVNGLAEHRRAVDAEIFFGGAIDQHVAQILRALHDDRRRHVLDDGVEERAGMFKVALGFFAFRNVFMHRHPTAALIG